MRYGMIGGGLGSFIGAVHRSAIALEGGATLVCGALSSTPERSAASGAVLGLDLSRTHADATTLLEREKGKIDFVVIVTPNDSHYPIAKAALEAGIHVVCDKPLAMTSAQGEELQALAKRAGLVCAVTYNYTGYPMVRQMAAMCAGGEIGEIRKVVCAYRQGWLAAPVERDGVKQAVWRTDPARAGLGGAMGDIGTHAENLISFVTGLRIESLCADVTSFVDGRALDDDASVLLRFAGGAKGTLCASQVCVGEDNNFSLRVYGDQGGLVWRQERPDELRVAPLGGPVRTLVRGGAGLHERAQRATRIPAGHPEGYIEAFANTYASIFAMLRARMSGDEPDALALEMQGADAGVRGLRFVESVVASARSGGWVRW